jgi:hypothetical protein
MKKVGFTHDADQLAVLQHRYSADAVPEEQGSNMAYRRVGIHRDDLRGHDVAGFH